MHRTPPVAALISFVAGVCLAGCGSGLRPIGSLSNTGLDVTVRRGMDGAASVLVALHFDGLGMQLGDECPVVIAAASMNGQPIPQVASGGQTECRGFDIEDCMSGLCLAVQWQADFPAGLSLPADGTMTIDIVDAGPPTQMVAPADAWAELTISDVPKYPYFFAPQATLTAAPAPPFDAIALAGRITAPPGPPGVPALTIDGFATASFTYDLAPAATGPRSFLLTFPAEADLPRPAAGQIRTHVDLAAPIRTCAGVGACSLDAHSDLPALSVTLP